MSPMPKVITKRDGTGGFKEVLKVTYRYKQMKIIEVTENKKGIILDLLLLADEQESMVDCYL